MRSTREQRARYTIGNALRSGRLVPAKHCEKCGKEKKTEGHHPNYDEPRIVQWLCRSCHMIIDGRMEAIHKLERRQPPKKCNNCQRFAGYLRKGRCHACNEYFRRHGIERPYIVDGRLEKMEKTQHLLCLRCHRPANIFGHSIRGYCTSCYKMLRRKGLLPLLSISCP